MRTITGVTGGVAALALFIGLAAPVAVSAAATSPDLGDAASYSVLAGSAITNGGASVVSGNLGISPSIGVAPHYSGFPPGSVGPPGAIHDADTSAANAQFAQKAVFDGPLDFVAQPCNITYPVDTELSTLGPLDPGIYCTAATKDFTLSGTLTLHGTGSPATDVWIFRSARNLIGSGAAKVIFTGTGGYPCNVWWRVATTATFTQDNAMVGNILAGTSITFGTGATLDGRAFAYTAEVTLLGNAISGPTCSATPTPTPTPTPSLPNQTYNSLTVIKQVINDNGGTAAYTDFPLFVNGNPVTSGNSIGFAPGTYTVSETSLPNYKATFTGDCNASGVVNHGGVNTHNDICTIVNDDIGVPVAPIPPLIHITKIPSPLVLPTGPGSVTYNYVVTNVGIVPMSNVTVADDACGPVTYLSGDTSLDSKLDVGEIWKYSCTKTLTKTTTNTVTATGMANGLTATDKAVATVVVGSPLPPPLIDLIKIPAPLFLPAAGGSVKYTYLVNNPGIVPLNNVKLVDNKCTSIVGPSGDTNGDGKLDLTETWTYSCEKSLNATTTNTATATGSANGFTVTHSSTVTVVVNAPAPVVAVPKLPKTGFGPVDNSIT